MTPTMIAIFIVLFLGENVCCRDQNRKYAYYEIKRALG